MADDDIGLPKATMLKAIKEQLPADVRLAGNATDAILRCCNEFVLMVAASANAISEQQKKSTILPDHVKAALEELGFGEYMDAVNEALEEFKEGAKEADQVKKTRKASRPGNQYTPEELAKMQQEMLQAAADRARALEGLPPESPAPPAAAQQQPEQQQQQQQVQPALAEQPAATRAATPATDDAAS